MTTGTEPTGNNTASTLLLSLFRQYKKHKFIFVEPGGNYGDYLIYRGAYKLADFSGIDYQTVKFMNFMTSEYDSDTVIYIHGSGGFVPWWSGTPMQALNRIVKTHRGMTIVGPTTFYTDSSFLKESIKPIFRGCSCNKVYIFARERVSYAFLKDNLPSTVEILLDHDTALNLNYQDLHKDQVYGKYKLYAIRRDKELKDCFKRNILSLWLDPIRFCKNFEHWIMLHAMAKEIITNRLHSSILATIINIPATLIANSYHKNRSVWEFSLRERGVKWHEMHSVHSCFDTAKASRLTSRILESSKFEMLIGRLYGVNYSKLCNIKSERYL